MFVKPLSQASTPAGQHFTKRQEALRKDVERCFGVLLKRFHILANPARTWDPDFMKAIWQCCIILHNMILADQGPPDIDEDIAPPPASVVWFDNGPWRH